MKMDDFKVKPANVINYLKNKTKQNNKISNKYPQPGRNNGNG